MNKTQSKHLDLYSRVTQSIVDQLERGVLPWEPAHLGGQYAPRNLVSQTPYRGINALMLGAMALPNPWFVTYKQAQELGGQVKKGEKGHLVVKYGVHKPKEGEDKADMPHQRRGFLKAYTVFHASTQTEGLAIPTLPEEHPNYSPSQKSDLVERVVQDMPNPPGIQEGATSLPCYRPDSDRVEMPHRRTFLSEDAYYKTLFHELGHATGHQSRLARPSLIKGEGYLAASDEKKKHYCLEELVAETSSAFSCARLGIFEKENEWDSAAYIGGWLQALKAKENKNWVLQAASQGQKATDYILKSANIRTG